jgi:integrase
MAGVTRDAQSGMYRIHFRYAGKQFHKSLKTQDEREAEALKGAIELTLLDLERGRLTVPPGANFWEFVKTDGKRETKPQLESVVTLEDLFRRYFEGLLDDARGRKTFKTETIHANHLKRLLGRKTELNAITGQVLQEKYINNRAREDHYGKPIQPHTIEKELDTLRMVWNRAFRNRVPGVQSAFPKYDLKLPEKKQKPPFQTWQEIQRAVSRGGLSEVEIKDFWDSAFLNLPQIAEVLEHVRNKATRRHYFYPLLVFVAHTGARLSECMRSQVDDFDFEGMKVRLRERKKQKGTETYRWVNVSPLLKETMKTWLGTHHPGGMYTISRVANKPFHEQTLHDDFEWFLKGSKWQVLKGFHVFRHSFASNLAKVGVDERVIDELMGHQTEAMRRRYRHLFPEQRENAIKTLFG